MLNQERKQMEKINKLSLEIRQIENGFIVQDVGLEFRAGNGAVIFPQYQASSPSDLSKLIEVLAARAPLSGLQSRKSDCDCNSKMFVPHGNEDAFKRELELMKKRYGVAPL